MEQFAAIRRDERIEGLSIRQLAERHHVHRRTVRQALASAVPPERKTPVRVSLRLEAFKPVIDAMLRADLDAPKKQRHTARRVLARLVDEHQAVDVSYSTVRDYIVRRRPEIAIESGRQSADGFVPQTHLAGAEAEVDFANLWVVLRGVKTKALAAVRRAETDLANQRARRPVALTDEEIAFLNRAGADVRAVFDAPSTTVRERKQLIRAIITEVGLTVHNEHRTAELQNRVAGRRVPELSMAMTKAGGHTRATDEDTVALIRRLAEHYDDQTIAVILSK